MKLSNTRLHLTGGVIAGFINMILLINLPVSHRPASCWLAIILWGAITCGWEYWQYLSHGSKRHYWEMRWKDTLCDLLAGNLPFILMSIIGAYGHSIV
jgi:hypothetical protein